MPNEPYFPPEEMVSASELREFLFCERAWFLSAQGFRVSAEAEAQRGAGIAFHRVRAAAAYWGARSRAYGWATLLTLTGIAILLATAWVNGR